LVKLLPSFHFQPVLISVDEVGLLQAADHWIPFYSSMPVSVF
jgi:hypothetical protein